MGQSWASYPWLWFPKLFSILETPAIATERQWKKIPSECVRGRVEKDSSVDIMVTVLGLEMTMGNNCADQDSTTGDVVITPAAKSHIMQICACGWSKVTSHLELKIHQGRKKCLREEGKGLHIDCFLQKKSNQSDDAQQLDANHSLQCRSTSVMEEVPYSRESCPTS